MTREEIIKRLEEIASKPGFIYTLAMMLRQDLFLDPADSADINWRDKISYQEFTLLIGLMVKHKIDMTLPTEVQSRSDNNEVYGLFEELHKTHIKPFADAFKASFIDKNPDELSDEEKEKEMKELFGSGEMMLEPMFYGGSGAYDFQYNELAVKKYAYDKDWLKDNKNFSMERAVKIAHDLKKLSEKKSQSEYKVTTFEDFCRHILDIFCFSSKDIGGDEEALAFLKAFSLEPGTANKDFDSIGQYNSFASHPIVKVEEDLFFLPNSFILTESIYESPFYWMYKEDGYKDTASKNRGTATEDIAYEMLLPVFGNNIYRDIKVQKNKGENATDIDILTVAGNKAIVFQAKSKRLTELSRRGDTEKLKSDFTDAVQKAYDQGLVCRDAILNKTNKLIDSSGKEIKLNESIDEVYIVCLTSDNYLALTNQVDTYLTKKSTDPFPIGMSLFDLDMVAFYLADPFEFSYYIRQRINGSEYFSATCEVAFLGFHLNQKLIKTSEADRVSIDQGYAQLVDANFPVMKGYHPKTKAVERLHTKWKNDKFKKLVEQVKTSAEAGFTDAIFYLYDLAGDGADQLIGAMERAIKWTKSDGKNHDFALIFEKGKSGITFVSQKGSPETLGEKLMHLAMARKYKTKADTWLALGSIVDSERLVDVAAFTKQPWEYDETLEDFSKVYLKKGVAVGKDGKKLGRNAECPCGKLRPNGKPMKFKNCCGQ